VKKIVLLAGFLSVLCLPGFAQTADVFVKDDPSQCWPDVRDVVHRYGSQVTEEEGRHIIHSGHFTTDAGDVVLSVQAIADKNKKGEEGCHIYVAVEGSLGLQSRGQAVNSMRDNFRTAHFIAMHVEAAHKAREKKAKGSTP
jgi:hypothetical protein